MRIIANYMRIGKFVTILILVGLILPSFSFAQEKPLSQPESLKEAKEMGKKILDSAFKELPGILKRIWKEEVLPVWKKMSDWFLASTWPKIKSFFKKEIEPKTKKEIEKRKPVIKEEFKKEKEELKKEVKEKIISKSLKSLWEKFKELIK